MGNRAYLSELDGVGEENGVATSAVSHDAEEYRNDVAKRKNLSKLLVSNPQG